MSVMFKTQQGRTLVNPDYTPDSLQARISSGSTAGVFGYELGDQTHTLFHVNPQHIVEWWDPAQRACGLYSSYALLREEDARKLPPTSGEEGGA